MVTSFRYKKGLLFVVVLFGVFNIMYIFVVSLIGSLIKLTNKNDMETTKIYQTAGGWQEVKRQVLRGAKKIRMTYTAIEVSADNVRHVAGGCTYTRIWGKSLDFVRECIEEYAEGREIELIEKPSEAL